MFAKILTELRKSQTNLTQSDIAKILGVAKTTYSSYEQGKRMPDMEIQKKIADYYGVSLDYLHGFKKQEDKNYYSLTEKDEKNIQKELEEMMNGLTNDTSLAYMKNGESELSEEDAALLRASMEQTLRLSKELAKKKFTPKKYRNSKE